MNKDLAAVIERSDTKLDAVIEHSDAKLDAAIERSNAAIERTIREQDPVVRNHRLLRHRRAGRPFRTRAAFPMRKSAEVSAF